MWCRKINGKVTPFRELFQAGKFSLKCRKNSNAANETPAKKQTPAEKKTIVFSGIQPTGSLHLGNYFGAVKLWLDIQNDPTRQLITSVVDMHAITVFYDPKILRNNIRQMFIELLSCGVDPTKTILFQQSRVAEHAQLQWIFASLTTIARLDNLPQFKEKSATQKEIGCGLFLYPVLQAADILLYRSQLVPVGEDQAHHLQLAQHIARVFNNKHGNYFPSPKQLQSDMPRVRSLREPTKKMSKSETDTKSRIELNDSPDEIRLKIKRAVTDFPPEISFEPNFRPGISNLVLLYKTVHKIENMENVLEYFRNKDKVKLKEELAEGIVEILRPIQKNIVYLKNNLDFVEKIMVEGVAKARVIAAETMFGVENLVGFRSDVKSVKDVVRDPIKP